MHSFPYKQLWPDIIAGLIAGVVFCIVYSAPLLMFLPIFMLMLCGLSNGARSGWIAGASACAVIAVLFGLQAMLFFLIIIAIPSTFFIRHALLWREGPEGQEWYPTERLLAQLAVIAAGFFMALALMASNGGQDLLQTQVTKAFSETLSSSDPDIARVMQHLVTDWSFAVFAMAGWLWVLMLYGFAVLANHVLRKRHRILRESLALSWHDLPWWLLCLLAVAALLAWFGNGNDRYCAKAIFLLLLLPYLLTGMARIHAYTRGKRHRQWWLLALYILLFLWQWTTLPVIAIGLYAQICEMLDKPYKIR